MGFIPLKEEAQPAKRGFIPLSEEKPKKGFIPLETEAPPAREAPLPAFSFPKKEPLEKPLVSAIEKPIKTPERRIEREVPSPYARPLPSEAPPVTTPDREPKPTTKLVQPRREREVDPYGAVIMKQLTSGAATVIPKTAISVGKIAEQTGKALDKTFLGYWEQELAKQKGMTQEEIDKIGRIDPERLKVDPAEYIKRGITKVEEYLEPKIPKEDKYKNIAAGVSKSIGELGVLLATGGFPALVAKEGVEKTEEAISLGASLPKSLAVGTAQSLMTAIKLYFPAKIVAHPALTTFVQRAAAGALTNVPLWVTANELEMRLLDEKILGEKHTPEEFRNNFWGALFSAGFITAGQAISLSARSTKVRPGARAKARVEKDITPPGEPPVAPTPRGLLPVVAKPPAVPVKPPVAPIAKPPMVPPAEPPISTAREPVRVIDGKPPEIPAEQIAAEDAAILQEAKDQLVVVNDKLSKLKDTADDAFKARHLDRERVYLEKKVRDLTPEAPPPVVEPPAPIPEPIVTKEPVPAKKLRKGTALLELTPSKRVSLEEIKKEIEAGRGPHTIFPRDHEGYLIREKIKKVKSTYPKYYQDKGYKREEVLGESRKGKPFKKGAIPKALAGEGLTSKEMVAIEDLLKGYRELKAEEYREVRATPKAVMGMELNIGDTFKVGGEQFEVVRLTPEGKTIIKDGTEKEVDLDETIKIDRGTLRQKEPIAPVEEAVEVPPRPLETAEVGLYRTTEEAPLIEMPEIVEFAKEINEGKYPKIKENLGRALGRLRSKAGPFGKADISLRADIFAGDLLALRHAKPKNAAILFEVFKEDFIKQMVTPETGLKEEDLIFRKDYNKKLGLTELKAYRKNPQLAPNVMAHEVGHLVDWLPDKTLKRGNILGRIKSLKKYMAHTIDALPTDVSQALTPKDRGRLRRQAMREVGDAPPTKNIPARAIWKEKVKKRYNALVKEVIYALDLITKDVVMQELKALSQARKPFDPEAVDPRYTKYRYSSKELYADAVSAFVNTPKLFKEKAPKFRQAFLNYMGNKPKVKEVYDELMARAGKGREAVVDERIAATYEMFGESDKARQEMRQRAVEIKEKVPDTLSKWLIDKYQAELKPIRRQEKLGGELAEKAREARYSLEEIPYMASSGEHFFYNVFDKLIKPAEDRGITRGDIGAYMFHNRIATERKYIANPKGYTQKDAIEILERLQTTWGAEKYKEVENIVGQYHALRKEFILPEIHKAGLTTPELIEYFNENSDYAKFSVAAFFENKFGSSTTAKFYKQVGTLHEIENPFISTVLQDLSLLRSAVINKAKLDLREVLAVEGLIAPADMRWSQDIKGRVPKKPKNPKLGTLTIMVDGKPQYFYTSKAIVESFKHSPLEATQIAHIWANAMDLVRSVLVNKNPLWMARNLVKDFKATVKNNPEIRMRDTLKLLGDYRAAFKEAWADVMKGEKSEDIQEMLRNRMLLSDRYYAARERTFDDELDMLAMEYNLYDDIKSKNAYNLLGRMWRGLDKMGKVSERTGKVAGYKYLERRTDLPAKRLAHRVRGRISTPDVKRQGSLQQLTNNFMMFSNVGKEGIRSSWESYKEDPAGYIWKTIWMDIVPKTILFAAGSAWLLKKFEKQLDERIYKNIEYFQKIIDGISDYDKKHYVCIPLYLTEDGKSVYIRIPQDYQGQLFGALAWDLMHGRITGKEGAIKTLVQEGSPYQLNPLLDVGSKLFQFYFLDINPVNDYTGRNIVPELAFQAGGWGAHEAMLKYSWRNLGGRTFYNPSYDIEKERSTTEEVLNTFPTSIIGTFIKISDRGKAERFDRIVKDIRKRGAQEALTRQSLIKHGINTKRDVWEIIDELRDRGLLTNQVHWQLIRYSGTKVDSAYINALARAKTNKERSALMEEFRKELSEEEIQELLQIWQSQLQGGQDER